MTLRGAGEFALIKKLAALRPQGTSQLKIGLGDDACAFHPRAGQDLLATCDLLIEKIHFDLKFSRPWQLGAKAVSASLSDIAAMGGKPLFFLVSLALPKRPSLNEKFALDLYRGMLEWASAYGAELAGGDTTASPGPLVIDVFLLGQVEEGRALTRGGARAGDAVFCTGSLGDSAAGLACLRAGGARRRGVDPGVRSLLKEKHLLPRPRVLAGRFLVENQAASSCIDLSDGLSSELNHLAEASGKRFEIWADRLPLSMAARAAARSLKRDSLDWALHGGEDYELLFTVPQAKRARVLNQMQRLTGTLPHEIGRVKAGPKGVWLVKGGEARPLKPGGWDHFK
jgi:thiamine-monophosphate kinase